MIKTSTKKTNGNIFTSIVRTVVREELEVVEKRLKADLIETFVEKVDASFRQYRDDVLTKLDEPIGKLKATQEEQAVHQLQHENLSDIPERVEKLEARKHPQQSP